MQVKEFPMRMCPAPQFDTGHYRLLGIKRGLITAVIIYHQVTIPFTQESATMYSTSAVPIVEDDDARPRL